MARRLPFVALVSMLSSCVAGESPIDDGDVGVTRAALFSGSGSVAAESTVYLEAAQTGDNAGGYSGACVGLAPPGVRRGFARWNLPSGIPSDATVTRVVVTFVQNRVRGGAMNIQLRRVNAAWTEGSGIDDNFVPPATPAAGSCKGGDSSASGIDAGNAPSVAGASGTETFGTTAGATITYDSSTGDDGGLVTDVQAWVTSGGSTNYGWQLRSTSEATANARQVVPGTFTVYWTVANGDACAVDSDCTSNRCVRANGADCASASGCVCCNLATCAGTCESCHTGVSGAGTCSAANGGTSCSSASCSGSTFTSAESCTGSSRSCPGASTGPCAGNFTCLSGSACRTSCSAQSHCASGYYCSGGSCLADKATGTSCGNAFECSSGFCVDGTCCDRACSGQCEACDLGGGICGNVTGAPHGTRTACASDGSTCGGFCNGSMSGSCFLPGSGTACRAASCTSGTETLAAVCQSTGSCPSITTNSCVPYICGATACLTSCSSSSDCVGSTFCNGSSMCEGSRANGEACTGDSNCASGECTDGVCCNVACGGQCQACNESGGPGPGTCQPVSGAPRSPRAACADDGTVCGGACDGALTSACTYPGGGTSCRSASCASGTETLAAACVGDGSCGSLVQNTCTPYLCSGSACGTSCSTSADCIGSAFCNGSSMCELERANGVACTLGLQCSSGSCTDGVCCNVACGGQCEACDVAGLAGTCSPVSGAPHGSRSACTDDGTGCAGTCDGATRTACIYPGSGVSCRSASCASGTETLAAGCAGDGNCGALMQNSCPPYVCSGSACGTSCAGAADCVTGAFCNGSSTCELERSNGAVCGGDVECISGNCVDGVCCDLFCTGQCEACDNAGSVGTCSAVTGAPHGSRVACVDDGSGCAGSCDGALRSSCTYPGSAVSCRSASCSAGTETLAAGCAGDGNCAAVMQNMCSPFLCAGSACDTTCAADTDCVAGAFCNSSSVCEGTRPNGGVCTSGGQCISGNCADGFCCNLACTGQCEVCDAAASPGVCTPVTGAPRGSRPACTDDGTGCGGTCNGSFTPTCVYPRSEIRCRSASCTTGTATLGAGCAGDGNCRPLVETMCEPYLCFGSTCGTRCTRTSECIFGAVCTGGMCVGMLPDGTACTLDGSCASGSCTDGVCCDTACAGRCEACGETGSEGTCVAVTGDPRGARPACPSDGSFCGGTCDGSERASCAFPGSETSCRPDSCADGMTTAATDCVGTGTCPLAVIDTCASGMCDGVGCADVSADAGFDGGLDGGADGSVVPADGATVLDAEIADAGGDPMDGGCSCRASAPRDPSHLGLLALSLAVVFGRRRRRRR